MATKAQRLYYEESIDRWMIRRDRADRVFLQAHKKWRTSTDWCDVKIREAVGNLAKGEK